MLDILIEILFKIISLILDILGENLKSKLTDSLKRKGFKLLIGEIYSLCDVYETRYPADFHGTVVSFCLKTSKKFFIKKLGNRIFKIPLSSNSKALGWVSFFWDETGRNKKRIEIYTAALVYSCLSIFIAKSKCLGALESCNIKVPIKCSKDYYIEIVSFLKDVISGENINKVVEGLKKYFLMELFDENFNKDKDIESLLTISVKVYLDTIKKHKLCNKIYIIYQQFRYPVLKDLGISYETSSHLVKRWIGIHPILGPLFVLNIYSNSQFEFGCISEFIKLKLKPTMLGKDCNNFYFPISLESYESLYIYICPKIHRISVHE